ncbi:hypothetical protein KM043_016259 [Ampulex compressa]|nr:hypothetical protein KM043_016259 [Ampulex compressa]
MRCDTKVVGSRSRKGTKGGSGELLQTPLLRGRLMGFDGEHGDFHSAAPSTRLYRNMRARMLTKTSAKLAARTGTRVYVNEALCSGVGRLPSSVEQVKVARAAA